MAWHQSPLYHNLAWVTCRVSGDFLVISCKGANILGRGRIKEWNFDCHQLGSFITWFYGGFDVWLDDSDGGRLDLVSSHGSLDMALDNIGLEDSIMQAGGLERQIKVFRLPNELAKREMTESLDIALRPVGDNPIWVSVYTEDGFQAWSSPIFAYRKDGEPGSS